MELIVAARVGAGSHNLQKNPNVNVDARMRGCLCVVYGIYAFRTMSFIVPSFVPKHNIYLYTGSFAERGEGGGGLSKVGVRQKKHPNRSCIIVSCSFHFNSLLCLHIALHQQRKTGTARAHTSRSKNVRLCRSASRSTCQCRMRAHNARAFMCGMESVCVVNALRSPTQTQKETIELGFTCLYIIYFSQIMNAKFIYSFECEERASIYCI